MLFAAVASQAGAADLQPIPMPVKAVYPVAYSWSGFYVGAFGGGRWADISDDTGASAASVSGWTAGGLAGFNLVTGNILYGLEADFGTGGSSGSNVAAGGIILKGDLQTSANARARIGYTFDRFMVFAAGGASFIDPNITHVIGGTTGHFITGWTAGGGVEYAVWSNLIVRAEYLYSSFPSRDYNFEFFPLLLNANIDVDHMHTVRGALLWKF